MALSKEVIEALNSSNGMTQRLNVGEAIDKAIEGCGGSTTNVQNVTNVIDAPKIAHHDKLDGNVTIATLKSAYNSLVDDLIKAGLMEE
mgnify:CR=1 FL=1